MRTYRRKLRLLMGVAALVGGLSLIGPAVAGEVRFTSAEEAFDQGIGLYRDGRHRMAVEALEFAAKSDHFRAQYYLARAYSNNTFDLTDHVKAYRLFKLMTERYRNVDRFVDNRAPYIAKAYLQVAKYHKSGMDIGGFRIEKDAREAARNFEIAATIYDDTEAQFELAQLYLSGEGVTDDMRRGTDWLILLARDKQHAGAQAYLAKLYWHGEVLARDPERALEWVSRAVILAPEQDRFGIEEIYQEIYCGSPPDRRERSRQVVMAGQKRLAQSMESLALLAPGTQRPQIAVESWRSTVRTCPDNSQIERFSLPRK